MRQWGSSLNHNGMSFFMATVPQSTKLYHGNGWPSPVKGMEWIAFEPEHALLFAQRFVPRTGDDDRVFRRDKRQEEMTTWKGQFPAEVPSGILLLDKHQNMDDKTQIPIHGAFENDHAQVEPGYLHTYTAKQPLRLLYIDGMSAGKTSNGTLDTQDFVLLHGIDLGDKPMFSDLWRAELLCKMAQNEFEGKVDGFLRMEGGFEIVMCDFEKSLKVHRVTRAGTRYVGIGGGQKGEDEAILNYYRAVTSRYPGIGGGRVAINYDNFITAYRFSTDLFPGSSKIPRLNEAGDEVLSVIRATVIDTVVKEDAFAPSIDWQAVADEVVQRYSDRLGRLASDELSELDALQAEAELALFPFIDFDNRNVTAEMEACSGQILPANGLRNLSSTALFVNDVLGAICATLSHVLEDEEFVTAKARVMGLVEWLGWPSWKRCPLCGYDEICFIPMWPFGTWEDQAHPSCVKGGEIIGKRGYWGFWRSHPPK